MNNHPIRLFDSDADIRSVGERMLACTLPKSEWTHEAHLAACAWLILVRPEIMPERDLPHLIRRYNESVGGVNSETEGYHETITQVSIAAVRRALVRSQGRGLSERVNTLLQAEEGQRDWPLRSYTPELLFSREARLSFVEPDKAELPLPAASACLERELLGGSCPKPDSELSAPEQRPDGSLLNGVEALGPIVATLPLIKFPAAARSKD